MPRLLTGNKQQAYLSKFSTLLLLLCYCCCIFWPAPTVVVVVVVAFSTVETSCDRGGLQPVCCLSVWLCVNVCGRRILTAKYPLLYCWSATCRNGNAHSKLMCASRWP